MAFNVSGYFLKGLLPFVIAVVIAILIDPIVDWLEKKRGIGRGLAVSVVLLFFLFIIGLLLIFVISRLVIELSGLYRQAPNFTRDLYSYTLNLVESARNYLSSNPLPQEAQNALRNGINTVVNGTASFIAAATNILFGILTGLPGFITVLIVSGIATFFISRDKNKITMFFFNNIPQKYIKPMSTVINEVSKALVGFFRAETILISITTIITITGLYILGVEYALTIGIIVGLLDLLPILGPGSVYLPWVFIEIVSGRVKFGLALLVLYAIATGIRQLIEPKVLSKNIGLNPLATLLALYLGLKFIGVWGIIIGPFIIIVIKGIIKGWNRQ
jgi:sporulation integral membrane protein YtvI